MAHVYGYKRWEVDRLTDEEVRMYMDQLGAMRFLDDLAVLRYAFGQIGEDDRKKMLEPSTGPDDLHTRAWDVYTASYRHTPAQKAERAQALPIRPETAEAIAAWIEEGGLNVSEDASLIWRRDILGIWERIKITALAAA